MAAAIAKSSGVSGDLVRRALMLSGDLTRTAEIALTAGEDGLREVRFEIFRPILPMLASTAEDVRGAVASFERSSVEWKLDGIRIQIHRRGDEVRIYTRNLNEITHALPGIVDVARRLPVTQAVLDGEALWMGDDGPAAFQDTVSQIDADGPPEGIVTFLFDVLHLDGDDLLDTPLAERSARLDTFAPQLKIPAALTADPDARQRLDREAKAVAALSHPHICSLFDIGHQDGTDTDAPATVPARQRIFVYKDTQTIEFTSTPPGQPRVGTAYLVSATGGGGVFVPALAGWLLAGPLAIGALAVYTRVDTRRRSESIYSAPLSRHPIAIRHRNLCAHSFSDEPPRLEPTCGTLCARLAELDHAPAALIISYGCCSGRRGASE
jgi:hypothetical protein